MSITTFCFLTALIEFAIGIPMLAAPASTGQRLTKLVSEDNLVRVVGMMTLLFCAAPLVVNFRPGSDLAGIIRLFAWLGALKGLVLCWWPGPSASFRKAIFKDARRTRVTGAIAVLAGAVLWAIGLNLG